MKQAPFDSLASPRNAGVDVARPDGLAHPVDRQHLEADPHVQVERLAHARGVWSMRRLHLVITSPVW